MQENKPTKQSVQTPGKKRKSSLMNCLDGDFAEVNEGEDLDTEIERFVTEPMQIRSPLMWWKHYEERFPSLVVLARKFLSVIGTSVPSERVCSVAG